MPFGVLKVPQFQRTLVITILGAFFCFLPNFLLLKINNGNYENSIDLDPLRKALSSTSFELCVAISMSVAFPILFDFFMDSFVYSVKDLNPAKLVIKLLLLISIIPNIVTLFYVIPNMRIDLLVLMPSCRIIPLVFSALWLLNTYGPSVWRWKLIEPVMLMHSVSTIISSFKPFVGDTERRILSIINLPFYLIGGLIVMYMCVNWLYHLYTIKRDSKSFTPDELICTLNMCAFVSLMISLLFLQYYLGSYLNEEGNPNIFTTRLYCITVFIIIVEGLTGRYERSKVLLQHAHREAELKRSLADISLGLDSSVLSDVVENLLESGDTTVEILDSLLTFDSLDQNIMELSMKQLSVTSLLSRYSQYDDRRLTFNMNLSPPGNNGHGSCSSNATNENEGNACPLACITADEFHFGKVIQTIVSNATECTPMHGTVAINVSIVSSDSAKKRSRRCSGSCRGCCYCFHKIWRSRWRCACRRARRGGRARAPPIIPYGHYILQIEVKDTGPGMTKEQEEEVLTNPFSFTAGVLQTHQGQGLGLWISHRIMELHHGALTVQSPGPCQGSTYIIQVPVFFVEIKQQGQGDAMGKKPATPTSTREFVGKLSSSHLSEREIGTSGRLHLSPDHHHRDRDRDRYPREVIPEMSLHSIPRSSGEYGEGGGGKGRGGHPSSSQSGGGSVLTPHPVIMPVLSFSRDMTDEIDEKSGGKSGDYRQVMNRFSSAIGLSLLNISDTFGDSDDRERENMPTEYNYHRSTINAADEVLSPRCSPSVHAELKMEQVLLD
eukprot:gene4793-9557_t